MASLEKSKVRADGTLIKDTRNRFQIMADARRKETLEYHKSVRAEQERLRLPKEPVTENVTIRGDARVVFNDKFRVSDAVGKSEKAPKRKIVRTSGGVEFR